MLANVLSASLFLYIVLTDKAFVCCQINMFGKLYVSICRSVLGTIFCPFLSSFFLFSLFLLVFFFPSMFLCFFRDLFLPPHFLLVL